MNVIHSNIQTLLGTQVQTQTWSSRQKACFWYRKGRRKIKNRGGSVPKGHRCVCKTMYVLSSYHVTHTRIITQTFGARITHSHLLNMNELNLKPHAHTHTHTHTHVCRYFYGDQRDRKERRQKTGYR